MFDERDEFEEALQQALDDAVTVAADFFKDGLPAHLNAFLPNALSSEYYESAGIAVYSMSDVEENGELCRTITMEQAFVAVDVDEGMTEEEKSFGLSLPEALSQFCKAASIVPEDAAQFLERRSFTGWESTLDGGFISRRLTLTDVFETVAVDGEKPTQRNSSVVFATTGEKQEMGHELKPSPPNIICSTLIH